MTKDMNSNIEKNIMAGVAAIYVGRKLSSRKALEAYALLASIVGIALFTSLPHVVSNLLHVESAGFPAVATFFLSAVVKTNLIVQAALLVGAIAGFLLVRDSLSTHTRHYA